jgi:hypothetical protein
MTNTKRNWLIGGTAAGILAVALVIGLWPEPPPPAPPKPPIVVMPVQMPPPPPEPTPEQLAAVEAVAAEQARLVQAAAAAKAKADAKPRVAKAKAEPSTKKKVTISKGQRSVTEVVVQPEAEPAKPKEVRFNMSQDGKKMTAEDFDAWMKAQGIRIVPKKTAEPPPPAEPAKTDDN